jgi:hypothetical protein
VGKHSAQVSKFKNEFERGLGWGGCKLCVLEENI